MAWKIPELKSVTSPESFETSIVDQSFDDTDISIEAEGVRVFSIDVDTHSASIDRDLRHTPQPIDDGTDIVGIDDY